MSGRKVPRAIRVIQTDLPVQRDLQGLLEQLVRREERGPLDRPGQRDQRDPLEIRGRLDQRDL